MVTSPRVYGNISPEDDYTHPLGSETNFNESMYFNFFDNARKLGGFLRVGNRANERYAEVTLTLYQPDGTVLFNYKRPEITHNDAFDAGGMKFETLEPLTKLRTTYEGSAVYLQHPDQMSDPKQAFLSNPHRKVAIDLLHEGVAPVYGTVGAEEAEPAEKGFGRAHYEQHMHVTGTVSIDGETVEVDAYGLRDHSWGPRYWQNIHSYRWLTCSFGPELNIMVSEIQREVGGDRMQWGVVMRDGVLDRVTKVDIDTDFREGNTHHRKMVATVGLDGGETLTVEGKVVGYIPLRNRREGHVTHIGEGMTEYSCLGHKALGISEYLDQVQ